MGLFRFKGKLQKKPKSSWLFASVEIKTVPRAKLLVYNGDCKLKNCNRISIITGVVLMNV